MHSSSASAVASTVPPSPTAAVATATAALVPDPSTGAPLLPPAAFPQSFLSLHIRLGMKAAELAPQPLSRYMQFIAKKLPHVTDIFVSTETDEVITALIG
jgi:hypothetical protein